MIMRRAAAAARRITADEAAGLVRSGMWIDYGAVLAQPDEFDKALAKRKADLRSVKIRSCLSTRPRAVLEADPDGAHFFWVSLHFSGYDRRKHDAGIAQLPAGQPGRDPGLLPPLHRPGRHRGHQDLPDGRRRLLQPQRGQPLAPCGDRARARRDRRGVAGRCPMPRASRTPCTSARSTTSSRAMTIRLPELPNAPPTDVDRAVAQADHRGARGRLLPADRDRRHAECGLQPACRQQRAGSGRAYRDADGRNRRSLQGRTDHRRAQDVQPGQDHLQLRARLADVSTTW